jgi:pimeloyl-ACP methyl ester carboxylesterase
VGPRIGPSRWDRRPSRWLREAPDGGHAVMAMLEINSEATYHEVHGPEGGAPVVLLHGGFCSIETWRSQIVALSGAGFQVHAPERPGDGRSPDPGHPPTFEWMVDHTVGYLDAAGLPNAHVVGFSDGAIIALLLAMRRPDRVRSLVSISGSLNPQAIVQPEKRDAAFAPSAFEALRAQHAALSPDGPGHADVVLPRLLQLWQAQPQIEPGNLRTITVPTLVMAGDHDLIRLGHTALIARSIPGAELAIVPNASHMLILERPEIVNAILVAFLQHQVDQGDAA